MANSSKRPVKLSTILRSKAFADGYVSAARGLPFDPDAHRGEAYHGFASSCLYERGRYFAVHCKVELGLCIPLKYGRNVSNDAIKEYRNAMLSGSV